MAKLGEVCKVSPSTKNIERQGAWLLNLDMVEQQTGRVIEYKYVGEDDLNGSIIQFDTENVLYSKLRPNLNKVVLPPKDGFSTSELIPLRPDASVLNKDYLAAFLRSDSFVTWAVSKTAGAKMPRLGTKDLMNAEIPVPSIEQQKKIAEKFKKLEQLISLRKQQLAKLDELVKARFVEMFGNKDYPRMKWNDVFNTTTGKLDSNAAVANGKYPFFTCSKEPLKIDSYAFDQTALLLTGNNAAGKYDVKYYQGKFNAYQRTYVLSLKHNWSYKLFQYQLEDKLLYLQTKSLGGLTKYLTLKILGELDFIVPPLALQNGFAAFVEHVDEQKQTVQQSLEKLELMKKALMQEYFG